MRKSDVEEWLVQTVMAGDSRSFEGKVGLHQGSVLTPLLFPIEMDGDGGSDKRTTLGVAVCR